MKDESIRIPRGLANRILTHAQQMPQAEVCGLIGASEAGRLHTYPVRNVASRPEQRFRMDPEGQIGAMRRLREAGESLFGIYHSHPHAPAAPSATDLAEAAYPEALYLIVSLDTQGVLEMRGFFLRDGKAEEVELEVV